MRALRRALNEPAGFETHCARVHSDAARAIELACGGGHLRAANKAIARHCLAASAAAAVASVAASVAAAAAAAAAETCDLLPATRTPATTLVAATKHLLRCARRSLSHCVRVALRRSVSQATGAHLHWSSRRVNELFGRLRRTIIWFQLRPIAFGNNKPRASR